MFALTVLITTFIAGTPTTQPVEIAPSDPPKAEYAPAIIDQTKPAYIPQFAKITTTPALQSNRDHSQMHQLPVFYPAIHIGGFYTGYASYYGYRANHGFYR